MRLTTHIILIISVLFMPWWVTALLMVGACFVAERFYEAIVYGIVIDALYRSPEGFHGFHYLATSFCLVVFILSLFLRKHLSW